MLGMVGPEGPSVDAMPHILLTSVPHRRCAPCRLQMGLGKTAQSISVLAYQRQFCKIRGPFLSEPSPLLLCLPLLPRGALPDAVWAIPGFSHAAGAHLPASVKRACIRLSTLVYWTTQACDSMSTSRAPLILSQSSRR